MHGQQNIKNSDLSNSDFFLFSSVFVKGRGCVVEFIIQDKNCSKTLIEGSALSYICIITVFLLCRIQSCAA